MKSQVTLGLANHINTVLGKYTKDSDKNDSRIGKRKAGICRGSSQKLGDNVYDMKKVINLLSLLSIAAIIMVVILGIYANNGDMYTRFIVDWLGLPLLLLAFPLFGRLISLAYNRDRIPPPIWLGIYSAILVFFIIISIAEFRDFTHDLPMALRKENISIEGEIKIIESTKSTQTIEISGKMFSLPKDTFREVTNSVKYIVFYLPRSKYVIDIVDEIGVSLLVR
jgi:hypothetical protein